MRVLTCSFHNIKTAAPTDRGCMHVNASLNTTLSPFCESGQRPASHAHQCMLPRFAPPDKRSLMKSRLSPCSAAAPPETSVHRHGRVVLRTAPPAARLRGRDLWQALERRLHRQQPSLPANRSGAVCVEKNVARFWMTFPLFLLIIPELVLGRSALTRKS